MTTKAKLKQLVEQKKKYLVYYRKLPVQKLAAASIGKTDDTIINWKKNDSDFSDQTEMAKAEWALENCEKVKSTEWLLERILHDHFPHRVEVETKNSFKLTREFLDRLQVED